MNVDGVDSDEIDEAMIDRPPDIADEARAAKQDLLSKKSRELYNIENVDHKVYISSLFVKRKQVNIFMFHCTIGKCIKYYNFARMSL
jgi:hypothetical protein